MNEVWQVGSVRVSRVVELEVTGGTRFILPDATRDACRPYRWLRPHFMDEAGNLVMSVHALVVDTGARRIVVDTCIGNDKERNIPAWSHLQTSFLADLEAAGYPRARIDTVLCTHLHVDHVGWNTMLVAGKWVPTFPNARYLVGETEWAYWDAEESSAAVLADSVRRSSTRDRWISWPRNIACATRCGWSRRRGTRRATSACASRRTGKRRSSPAIASTTPAK